MATDTNTDIFNLSDIWPITGIMVNLFWYFGRSILTNFWLISLSRLADTDTNTDMADMADTDMADTQIQLADTDISVSVSVLAKYIG